MASGKKTGKAKAKPAKKAPARKPAPKKAAPKPAPKPTAKAGADKAAIQKAKQEAAKQAAALRELAAKQKAEAKAAEKMAALRNKDIERHAREIEHQRAQLEKERDRLAAEQKKLADERAAMKQAEVNRKAEERQREADRKAAEKKAEQDRKAAEKAEAARLKAEQKAAEAAARAAEKAAGKKRPIPTTSLAATPIIRPLGEAAPTLAPPPPPAKPGYVDHQMLSAVSYGMFSAVNKSFGFAGQSVVKNAALRMLEYGYKRGWLPPKSKEPIRALNEFFGRLETMGYADKIHIAKKGEGYVLEVQGLADFDAVHSLRELHYPLLPIFLGAMLEAIVDQYFQLKTTMEPIEFVEAKRGFNLGFSVHERMTAAPEVSRLPAVNRLDEYED